MSSLCHIWWICGCAESFALVLKWGGPGVRRKGLPQAPPAVWWSVAGSFSQPSGTITTLWSVSFSDLPGQGKSALFFYLYLCTADIWNLSFESRSTPDCIHHCFYVRIRLAINICCSPAWLRDNIYWKIDAYFLQYCSNFLWSHGGRILALV